MNLGWKTPQCAYPNTCHHPSQVLAHPCVSDRLGHVPCTCPGTVIAGTHPNADVDTCLAAVVDTRLVAVVDTRLAAMVDTRLGAVRYTRLGAVVDTRLEAVMDTRPEAVNDTRPEADRILTPMT